MAQKKPSKPQPKKPPKKQPAVPAAVSPAALSIDHAAELLTKAGGRKIARETIAAHVAAGAPTNADGSLHLIHYTAWLAREVEA